MARGGRGRPASSRGCHLATALAGPARRRACEARRRQPKRKKYGIYWPGSTIGVDARQTPAGVVLRIGVGGDILRKPGTLTLARPACGQLAL